MTYEEARDKATETVKQYEAEGKYALSTYSYHDAAWGVSVKTDDTRWKLVAKYAHQPCAQVA